MFRHNILQQKQYHVMSSKYDTLFMTRNKNNYNKIDTKIK